MLKKMSNNKALALITGATSGFGKAIAERFAAEGHHIIITGRRAERLEEIKNKFEDEYNIQVTTLCFDIRNREAVLSNLKSIESLKNSIGFLINNAGLALGRDTFQEANMLDWEQMIDTNLKGLMYISQEVAKWMMDNKKGHIINVGSTAAKEAYPSGNMYCATKSAVDAISKAMRIDLLPFNIKVSAIHPGAAETEFSVVRFKGDQAKADAVYNGFEPLQAKDIANITYFVASSPAHVCINDLVVTPTAQANSYVIHRG
jgi:3-hydroxy acid dehydrogenase / malonic semialdehyde reductase